MWSDWLQGSDGSHPDAWRSASDLAGFAMDRYAYYVCHKCRKAYYGGEARCEVDMAGEASGGEGGGLRVSEDYDPSELVCGGCSDVARAQMCVRHGADFLEYKCRYCCSVRRRDSLFSKTSGFYLSKSGIKIRRNSPPTFGLSFPSSTFKLKFPLLFGASFPL